MDLRKQRKLIDVLDLVQSESFIIFCFHMRMDVLLYDSFKFAKAMYYDYIGLSLSEFYSRLSIVSIFLDLFTLKRWKTTDCAVVFLVKEVL